MPIRINYYGYHFPASENHLKRPKVQPYSKFPTKHPNGHGGKTPSRKKQLTKGTALVKTRNSMYIFVYVMPTIYLLWSCFDNRLTYEIIAYLILIEYCCSSAA